MNIALIGLGMVADTHVAALKDAGHSHTLCGVLGRDPSRTAAFAAKHDVPAYDSVEQIAQDDSVDFVILATPPDARTAIVTTLAEAGKPILMEKPVERDLSGATNIVALCSAEDVPLGVIFQHRARAASRALKHALEAGTLGTIVSADLRVPWWRDQDYYDAPGRGTYTRDGGGVMISQAIHTLDLALWLLGPVAHVQALMRTTPLHQMEAEDWAGALLEWESGVIGTLMATTAAAPGAAETITINGSLASADLGSGVLTITYADGRIETTGTSASTGGGADPMAFTHAWHQTVIEDFADALAQGRSPMVTGREALNTHMVIDAMERSNASGRRVAVPQ